MSSDDRVLRVSMAELLPLELHDEEEDENCGDDDNENESKSGGGYRHPTTSRGHHDEGHEQEDDFDGSHVGEGPNPSERIRNVQGLDGRANDIIYCPPLSATGMSNGFLEDNYVETNEEEDEEEGEVKVAVYFGGDIQDFPEIMNLHRDHRVYVKWSLESTALFLREQFPLHHIIIIRPNRMQMLTYSCFDNFVPCNNTGVPEHTPNHSSLQHLEALLRNLSTRIHENTTTVQNGDGPGGMAEVEAAPAVPPTDEVTNDNKNTNAITTDNVVSSSESTTDTGNHEVSFVSSTTTEETSGIDEKRKDQDIKTPKVKSSPNFQKAKITLIGFSKGCVVLNQFLYEFHYLKTLTPDDHSMEGFLRRIEHMYWLDGGHSGGKNTWITARSLLETLHRLSIGIHVHMTPYQLKDERRPWIAKEEKTFSEQLDSLGARIRRHVHFADETPSLELHFRLLTEFIAAGDEEDEEEDVNDFDDDCLDMC